MRPVGDVIDALDWDPGPAPAVFSPVALKSALYGVRHADSEETASWAAHQLFEAVGHGHAACLFGVAAPATAVLVAVADRHRQAALAEQPQAGPRPPGRSHEPLIPASAE